LNIENLYDIFLGCGGVVSTDTRTIAPGSIFFALRGERFDANAFAAAALEAGAAYAVIDNPEVAGADDRFIVVDDSLRTLQQLARLHRRKLALPILAITGSNGKTTTKELIARVLAAKYRISVTQGNLNNHIGVPLTLLSMTRETQLGIVEMGASARGEIALLCSIAMPNYGLITNIGRAHLEGFGGTEGVRAGKGELFDYLQGTLGTAFYAEGDEVVASMVRERPELPTVPYPWYEAGDPAGGFITVKYRGEMVPTHLVGDYNRYNISAAIGVGEYFGVPRDKIAGAIASYDPDNRRSQRIDTGRNTLVADCYNANPSSMRAALENFAQEASTLPKAVILGDMLELGDYAAAEHEAIVRLATGAGFEKIFLVGENFCRAAAAAGFVIGAAEDGKRASRRAELPPSADRHRPAGDEPAPVGELASLGSQALAVSFPVLACFASTEELLAQLDAHPLTGHLILLKGSHGIGLERTIEKL